MKRLLLLLPLFLPAVLEAQFVSTGVYAGRPNPCIYGTQYIAIDQVAPSNTYYCTLSGPGAATQWVALFSGGSFIPLTGDATSTATGGLTEVIGLLNHALPSLSTGFLNWTGTAWALSSVATTSGTSLLFGNGSGGFSNAVVGTGLSFAGGTLSATSTATVTSFSSGALSPLFTTSVATATTTPALSFSLSNFSADNIFGNFTGSSAAPSTQAIPSCANDGAHALVYASHTLTCESISNGSSAFSALTGGTNSSAAMLVGTGASLGVSGTGSISASTIAGGSTNDLVYQAGGGTTGFLAPVNSAVLVTNGSGVPSESTTLPTGLAMQTPASIDLTHGTALPITGLANGTSTGEVFYWNGSAWTALAGNASGTLFLQETSSGVPSWATPSGTISGLTTGVIPQAASSTTIANSSPQLDNAVTTANTLTYAGTGGITASGGPITSSPASGVAGSDAIVGNTSEPSLASNTFTLIGPNSASFTAYGLQMSATGPSAAGVMLVGSPSSNISQVTFGTVLPNGVTATTQTAGNNSTDVATTAYVNTVYNLIQTSGSPYTMSAITGIYWNNTASAYSWDLPTPAAGLQVCVGNYQARATAQSLIPPAGVTIYFEGAAGTSGSSTGLVSGGAAGDFICLVGTSTTTYEAIGAGYGTWTNH
jgi:hypothetical protein